MNEEVKELLEELKEYAEGGMNGLYPLEENISQLLNYITNLRKENEELRRFRYTIRKDETKMPPAITRTYKREYEELQQRIDKTNEFIDNWLFEAGGNGACMDYEDIVEMKILLNSGDE